jgi:hypothetical protein
LAGVGCTASLASEPPKRGPHRMHVACQTAEATVSYSLELTRGARDRPGEEALCAALVLAVMAEAAGVERAIERYRVAK